MPGKSSSTEQKSGLRGEHLLLAIVVMGIIFFVIRGRNNNNSTSMPAETPPVTANKSTQVQVLANNQPTVDVRKYQQELNRQRAQFAQARAFGLKALSLKNQGETISIPVVFVPRKIWCQGGDLDTMRYASRNDDSKDFLISLEGIGRGGKNPFVRTSLRELYKGVNHTFTISRPKETTSYGLYICTDNRKENSCQRKGMETHAQLSDQLAANPDKTKAQDRILYFQNLLIDGKKLETYRSDDFSDNFQKVIGSHLSRKGIRAAEFQAAWKANSTLKSAPVDIRDGKLILSLPYNDPRCTQSLTGPIGKSQ